MSLSPFHDQLNYRYGQEGDPSIKQAATEKPYHNRSNDWNYEMYDSLQEHDYHYTSDYQNGENDQLAKRKRREQ